MIILEDSEPFEQIEICSDSKFYARNKSTVFPFKTRYLLISQKSYLLAILIQ